jgi:GT2 family glycosyltransferase
MRRFARFLAQLALALLAPVLVASAALALLATDLAHRLFGSKSSPGNQRPSTSAASIVIPNWNGRELLARYLPSVIEAAHRRPGSEIIVVDNGSTDGSAGFVREHFPEVRVLELEQNLGFGGGSNAGFRAARHDIVVLLNSDMRVEPDFLGPLLEGFTDEKVFSVTCQIFFRDPAKKREETGLTQGWWESGWLRVRHRADDRVTRLFPCFYGGGGSSAYDRRKFLELGGFDPLLAPFYLEDADLGYMAWKRGWKVLYEPRSKVYHEHRGTIGKHFTRSEIDAVLRKNFILFCWKNIHEWRRLGQHLAAALGGAWLSLLFGESLTRSALPDLWRTFRALPQATRSRWRARSLACVSDTEAFRRPLGGYFRDRFESLPLAPDPLRVLFVSPYPIAPPVHGGAVFMYQTCRRLAALCELHLVSLLERPEQEAAHRELAARCASAEFLLRTGARPRSLASLTPFAVREFEIEDLQWTIHRKLYLDRIDVLQLEYFPMGQYAGEFRRIATVLFEHDVYFQSVARLLPSLPGIWSKARAALEYMRALRFELRLLGRFDRVQFCTRENASYVAGFLPSIAARADHSVRSGIDVGRYRFTTDGREPFTMLFVGSFRHQPNLQALNWLIERVLPRVLAERPEARLIVVGSEPPPAHSFPAPAGAVELLGYVGDIREPLERYAVFVCPILSGSGVRVKLLEAFASGIPVVSTRLGAEGLTDRDGEICVLADDPESFARGILRIFDAPEAAQPMVARARQRVEERHDAAVLTERLVATYRDVLCAKRESNFEVSRSDPASASWESRPEAPADECSRPATRR